jgi:hypothetical protein
MTLSELLDRIDHTRTPQAQVVAKIHVALPGWSDEQIIATLARMIWIERGMHLQFVMSKNRAELGADVRKILSGPCPVPV